MTVRQETKTVLVVDDEESVRALLGVLVKRAGGDPVLIGSAEGARERVRAEPVGSVAWLAIVDKNLPDGSGVDLLRWLREASPTTEVMMVTGYGNLDSAVEALRLGAFDYILKPFDTAWVVRRVELALEQRRLRAALAITEAELRRTQLETIDVAGRTAELLEPHASGHARRLSLYAGVVARALDGTAAWVEALTHAALLHDIGNVGVPRHILTKPGPLAPAELVAVRAHVAIGADILAGVTSSVLCLGREVILSHHERWDGSGYPLGLRGEDIPLAGRIVGLLDAWDAMLSQRPYRRALLPDEALAQIRGSTGFDPHVVEAFLDVLPQLRRIAASV